MKGHFKCQHCGVLLHVASFDKPFWFLFAGAVVVLAVFALVYQRLFVIIGPDETAAIWVVLFLLIASVISYGTWKYALIEIVSQQTQPSTNISS